MHHVLNSILKTFFPNIVFFLLFGKCVIMFWCLLGLWSYGAYDTYEIQRGILLDNVDDIQTNQKLFLLFFSKNLQVFTDFQISYTHRDL